MKKAFLFLFTFVYLLSLSNCSSSKSTQDPVDPNTSSSVKDIDCGMITQRWQSETRDLTNSSKLAKIDPLVLFAKPELKDIENFRA